MPLMRRVGPVLVWLGLVVLLFTDLLFLPRMLYGRDVNSYFLPLEMAVHRAWASGHLPLWFAGVSGGKPLLPNPNAGVFYPLRLAAAALPFAFGFKLYLVLHVFIAGWGTIRLARALGAGRGAQVAAAAAYALSGPSMSALLFSNMLPGVALLPWIALSGYRLAARPRARSAALVAILLTLDVLGGEPFTLALGLIALVSFAAWAPRDRRARALLFAGGAAFAAILASGIQLVPMFLYLPATLRAQVRFRLLATLQWSLSPARLAELVVPYPFGDPTGFDAWRTWGGRFFSGRPGGYMATIFAGAFATAGLVSRRARFEDRGLARALGSIFGASLLLAGAGSLVPDRLLSTTTRLALRYPEKFVFGAVLVAAIFAAKAWDTAAVSPRFALPVAAASIVLALAALLARAAGEPLARAVVAWTQDGRASAAMVARELPRALLEASLHWGLAAAAAALLLASPRRRWRSAGALFLVVADVALATRRVVRTVPERESLDPPPAVAALNALDPGVRFSFVPQANYFSASAPLDRLRGHRPDRPPEITLRAFAGSLWGRPSVLNSDPDASDLARHGFARRDLFRWLDSDPASAANFLAGYSVKYLLRYPDATPLPGAAPAATAGAVVIDALPDAVPRYSIASRWEEFPSGMDAESALGRQHPPPTTAIVETGRRGSGRTSPGTIDALAESPEGFDAVAACPEGCWLRATRGYWKFRDVRVDGKPAGAVPERLALSAVWIPPGRHRIEWEEKLPGGAWGLAATLAGLGAILAAAWRRSPEGGEES
jgi:hypothetical protein